MICSSTMKPVCDVSRTEGRGLFPVVSGELVSTGRAWLALQAAFRGYRHILSACFRVPGLCYTSGILYEGVFPHNIVIKSNTVLYGGWYLRMEKIESLSVSSKV